MCLFKKYNFILEENRQTLFDINGSKISFDSPPRVMKIKIDKWDLIKLKNICTAEETINKMKRQPSEWAKILTFANEVTDKITPKYISNSCSSIAKKQPNQKMDGSPE